MTLSEAQDEALKRWPWNGNGTERGWAKDGIARSVGIVRFDMDSDGDPKMVEYRVLGFGSTFEQAFARAVEPSSLPVDEDS